MGYYQESLEELEKAGLLIDSDGADANKVRYIFDVLNDVNTRLNESKRAVDTGYEVVDAKDTTSEVKDDEEIIYVNGKVQTDAGDKNLAHIIKTMKKCNSRPLFE